MKLLLWIFQFAFGCHHSQLSGVFTIQKRTYQVCLECGQEFEYSWTLMRSMRSHGVNNVHAPLNSARPADAAVL
ncbi:MAG TPA: hypothetical protein VF845_02395 [Terriglobales bacterium]|jgi:hypothetical protein